MFTPSPLKGVLVALAISATCSLPALSQTLDFIPFETDGVSDLSDLKHIDLNALLIAQGDDLLVRISNDSPVGTDWISAEAPTITRIHFDDGDSQLGASSIVGTSGYVDMSRDDSINLPGGNTISFVTDVGYDANPPPTQKGIDPGESIDILFPATTIAAFLGQPYSRIGLHVQQIGDNYEDSASYISVVPEPSIAALGGLGLLLLIRRRR